MRTQYIVLESTPCLALERIAPACGGLTLVLGLVAAGILIHQVSVWVDNGMGYSDEELHYHVAGQLTSDIGSLTGSRLIGENVTRTLGYLKESVDTITGSGWSEADLEANEAGIANAR